MHIAPASVHLPPAPSLSASRSVSALRMWWVHIQKHPQNFIESGSKSFMGSLTSVIQRDLMTRYPGTVAVRGPTLTMVFTYSM